MRNLNNTYCVEENNGWKEHTLNNVNNLNNNSMAIDNMGVKFYNNIPNFDMS